jgi:ElaA protein
MEWHCRDFAALELDQLYGILKLRLAVFVIEQRCFYQDLDGLDQQALHVFASDGGEVVAAARVFAPGVREESVVIGRVLTATAQRNTGLGKELMARTLAAIEARWGKVRIRLNAQKYVERFYAGFGFERAGDDFLEDDIPHLPMARAPGAGKDWPA